MALRDTWNLLVQREDRGYVVSCRQLALWGVGATFPEAMQDLLTRFQRDGGDIDVVQTHTAAFIAHCEADDLVRTLAALSTDVGVEREVSGAQAYLAERGIHVETGAERDWRSWALFVFTDNGPAARRLTDSELRERITARLDVTESVA